MKKRLVSIFIILVFLVSLLPSNTTKVSAKEYGDYGDYGIFPTHETDEYLKQPTDSLLKYQVITDSSGNLTNEVSAIGSYILTKTGIDETKSASEVTIPSTVTYNGTKYTVVKTEGTFYGKKEVKKVNFADSIIEIGFDTLKASGIVEFHMTKNVQILNPNAVQNCANLKTVTVDPENPYYKSYKNFLYTKDTKRLVTTANLGKKVTVINGITAINSNAFDNCIYFSGENGFVNIVNEITLPTSIILLEEYSIPYTIVFIQFKGKTVPKVNCDFTGIAAPILIVPSGTVNEYRKISYNGIKINEEKVVTTLNSKAAIANKKENDTIIGKLKWDKALDMPYGISTSNWNKFKDYFLDKTKKYTNIEDKVNAVLVDIANNIYINEDYYGPLGIGHMTFSKDYPNLATLYGMHTNKDKGTISSYAVEYTVSALRAIGVPAIDIYSIVDNLSSDENHVVIAKVNGKVIIIDIAKELSHSKGGLKIDTTNGLPELKYYNVNRSIFNFTSKIFWVTYYTKQESQI